MNPPTKGFRFNGGDELTSFQNLVHEFMMNNELQQGYQGYELIFANTENSGLSFGGNQRDMSVRPDAVNDFINILIHATDQYGEFIIPRNDLCRIFGDNNAHLTIKNVCPDTLFGEDLPSINAALQSDYGMDLINAAYVNNIHEDILHIEHAIDLMQNPAAQVFYETDFGKALLFDYHNQYHLSLEGVFIKNYIDGIFNHTSKNIYGTDKYIVAPTNHYNLQDHIDYLHSTKMYAEHAQRVDDRIENSLAILYDHDLSEIDPYLKDLNFDSLEIDVISDQPDYSISNSLHDSDTPILMQPGIVYSYPLYEIDFVLVS